PTDRRAALVRITDAGRAVLAQRLAVRAEVLRARVRELSDDDQQALIAALPAIERLAAAPNPIAPRKARS
ncbi:MAG TPA: hypothetical protein VKB75_07565, partial [Jatrophihabitans sp.]|nr:hypothetical protein [Jatrophihabitans sp.]